METFGGLKLLDFTTGASGRLVFGRFAVCDNEEYMHSIWRQQLTGHTEQKDLYRYMHVTGVMIFYD